jgi:hypothetical protein
MGFFRILAETWGLEIPTRSAAAALDQICQRLLDPAEAAEITESLPEQSRQALMRLLQEGGSLPAGDFTQAYGQVRSMGPGRRDREKPWRQPISAAERLHYLGLIGRAFADSAAGPKEFIFIPSDLVPVLADLLNPAELKAEASSAEPPPKHHQLASSSILDDATTLLADLRRQPGESAQSAGPRLNRLAPFLVQPRAGAMLVELLLEEGILTDQPLQPEPAQVAGLLASPRHEALQRICLCWLNSQRWNDFLLLSHLEPVVEASPQPPELTRRAALALFKPLTLGRWYSLADFVAMVKQKHPTFARPGDDFDGWLLRDRRTGNLLRGWPAWDAIDGALLKALVSGPLHWLGAVDLGSQSAESAHATHFRLTGWSVVFFPASALPTLSQPEAQAEVHADGRLILPRAVPRRLRYQVARLCSWESFSQDQYHYRLKPSAVLAAAEQGLQGEHVERLLHQLTEEAIPPSLGAAIQRLIRVGIEARLEPVILIRSGQSETMDALAQDKKTARWIKERLSPTTAIVAASAVPQLVEAAARKGLLLEPVVN